MNKRIIYIPDELIEQIHSNTIDVSGGGDKGIIDIGRLKSVLAHIQNDDYYPNFVDKITHLFFCVCKFHAFVDGNYDSEEIKLKIYKAISEKILVEV